MQFFKALWTNKPQASEPQPVERVAAPSPAPPPSVDDRSCCDEESCVRKDIANLLDPEAPIVDRICTAASAVARTCGSLNADELNVCASRLFDVPMDCDLAKAFRRAYQKERDAIAQSPDAAQGRGAGK